MLPTRTRVLSEGSRRGRSRPVSLTSVAFLVAERLERYRSAPLIDDH